MRVSKVVRAICGFSRKVVIMGVEVIKRGRPALRVHVRLKVRKRDRCGRFDRSSSWLDNGGRGN